MIVTTNYQPRDVIEAYELTPAERTEFDYIDWDAVERGETSATFFRYKGQLYDLGEFEVCPPDVTTRTASPDGRTFRPSDVRWHGIQHDSAFSGILVRYADEHFEQVVVARYCV